MPFIYEQDETKRQRILRQIENVLVAQAMMAEVPRENIAFGLQAWAEMCEDPKFLRMASWNRPMEAECDDVPSPEKLKEFHCGSAACFGGWCAIHPHFKRQGIQRAWNGAPEVREPQTKNGRVRITMYPSEVSEYLFGRSDMFYERMPGEPADEKVLIERRLKKAMEALVHTLNEMEKAVE